MKFAVIEYASKTGDIWRHTDARPNYLADPAGEIDPTSFGCYVSALRGEHIPLTKLIGTRNIVKRLYHRISGRWPNTYPLAYLAQFDAVLVVYDLGNGPTITSFTQRLKRLYPQCIILGVPTQPYGIIQDWWQRRPTARKDFVTFINAVDVFVTIVASTKTAWQSLSATPTVYLPQPYPVAYASQHRLSRAEKQKIIFIAGVPSRDNILKGYAVAVELQKKYPDYSIHLTATPGEHVDTSQLTGTRYKIVPFKAWQQHLEYVSRVMVVINTDYTQTRGRVQVDCAAVGTPSIGADSDGQADLFPHLPANRDTTVAALVQQGSRLLADDDWYEHTALTAYQRLQKYEYEPSAQRIIAAIHSVQEKKQL